TRTARPVRLRVGVVGLDLPVRATGVAADGSMELPDTVRRAGWYRYSALPGSTVGSTVLAAHVDTRAEGLGPFARLAELDRGDRIEITDRSGDDHRYRVTVVRRITRTALPVEKLFDRDGSHRLVLITCGGAYDARNGYRDNVVVLAEPDP
ncbi:MAG TPA: class F sortase, partial [Microlunatus sp.]|nr:class F sortase [Microlunatus sp.]